MADPRKPNPGPPPEAETAISWNRPEFRLIPLPLSARLARGKVRLSILRGAGPGSVIPLETNVGAPAELVSESAVLGEGEIVEIKSQLALRLTRLGRKVRG